MSNLFLHRQRAGVAANRYVKLAEDGPGEIMLQVPLMIKGIWVVPRE